MTDVRIDLAEGWTRREAPAPVLLLAQPPDRDGLLAPMVEVAEISHPQIDEDDDYVAWQLSALEATHGGSLLYVDRGNDPQTYLDVALATEHLGTDVTIVQRHLLHDLREHGRAFVATGAAADVEWPAVGVDVVETVRSLRIGP